MKILKYLAIILVIFSCKDQEETIDANQQQLMLPEIAFITNRDGNYEIYAMDPDGKDLVNLTNHDSVDFAPGWSGDGDLYFYSGRDGNNEIYVLKSGDTVPTRLTNNPAMDALPAVSPDGNLIAFMSDRDSLSRNLFVMKKDGSGIRQLTNNNFYEESPAWSPDGNKILFTRQLRDSLDTSHAANGEIFIMDADGKNVRRLTNKEGFDSGAQFSPDGKKIAFYGLADEQWDLYLIDPDGQNMINLTNDSIECYSPTWSPDGKWIAYTAGSNNNYNIWRINLETKEKIQLTDTPGRDQGADWRK